MTEAITLTALDVAILWGCLILAVIGTALCFVRMWLAYRQPPLSKAESAARYEREELPWPKTRR